jgi:hypothetical protein
LGDACIVNDHFADENILKIGFTNWNHTKDASFSEYYDIVLEKEFEWMDELVNVLKIFN